MNNGSADITTFCQQPYRTNGLSANEQPWAQKNLMQQTARDWGVNSCIFTHKGAM